MWVVFSLAAALFAGLVIVLSKAGIKKLDPLLVFGIEAVCMVVITWSIIFAKKITNQINQIDKRVWMFILVAGVLTTFL